MLEALGFFALMEAAGLAAAPLAALVLGRLPGAGLGFAKVLGVLLIGWLVWMAGSIGLASYGPATILGAFVLVAVLGALSAWRLRRLGQRLREREEAPARGRLGRWRRSRLAAQALPAEDPLRLRLWAGSEAVFAVAFAVMALLIAFAPDVWNTEKPMDAMLMTAIQASDSFPPQDAWMAGETVNYYYLGHLLLALPGHALSLGPDVAYNLAVAGLFALSASAVFTLAGTLWAATRDPRGGRAGRGRPGGRRAVPRARQPGGRARVAAGRRPAGRLRLVLRLARDPGHDQRVPVVLVHARGPPRAPAGDPVHAAGARVRAAGRARRPARRPRLARGGRGADGGPGGRRAVRDQLVVVPGRRRAC